MPSVAWVVEFDALEQLARELPDEAAKILRYGANLARRKVREKLRSPGGWRRGTRTRKNSKGQTYPRERLYRASEPGQPPARITGELLRAVRVRRTAKLTFEVGFGTGKGGMDHVARILEGGSARIAARPFFGQAFEETVGQVEREMEELLDVDVNAATGKVTWKHGNRGREIVSVEGNLEDD